VGTWRIWSAVAVAAVTPALATACGGSKKTTTASTTATTSTPAVAASPAVEKLVPAAVKSKGTLTVAMDASYPPDEFIASNGHTVVGMDADLSNALVAVMGLKAKLVNATFDTIIPGLQAGKYDLGASSFTDNKQREKVVDFVDYVTAGEAFFTRTNGGTSVTGLADLCGKTVSVESGTTEETDAKHQSGLCTKAGKPKVTLLVFPTQTAANLALSSGRAQVAFADSTVADYQVKQSNGAFKLTGPVFGMAPYGLAVPKNLGLTKAVQAALRVLVSDGTYHSILAHWGISSGATSASAMKINGATS
jgi:polar amino acid transport system substrate-binding protein